MKKTQTALQRKPRLTLSRETIQVLHDPALLELARGEGRDSDGLSAGGLGCHIATGSGGC